ncbi:hypothetical protein PWT90_09294 [Aphanocladium album]|nr:hypothetical protein PWT90_09294 [Aphanocladium album]
MTILTPSQVPAISITSAKPTRRLTALTGSSQLMAALSWWLRAWTSRTSATGSPLDLGCTPKPQREASETCRLKSGDRPWRPLGLEQPSTPCATTSIRVVVSGPSAPPFS